MSTCLTLASLAATGLVAACAPQPAYAPAGYAAPAPAVGTNTAVGTAAGAVGGAIIGNSLGGRNNSAARTIGGAAVGGLIGNATERPAQPAYVAPASVYAPAYAPSVVGTPVHGYGK